MNIHVNVLPGNQTHNLQCNVSPVELRENNLNVSQVNSTALENGIITLIVQKNNSTGTLLSGHRGLKVAGIASEVAPEL